MIATILWHIVWVGGSDQSIQYEDDYRLSYMDQVSCVIPVTSVTGFFVPYFRNVISASDVLWSLTPAQSQWIEWTGAIFNLLFLIFLIQRKVICWIFGILGSLLVVALWGSYEKRLYSEAILYLIYALLGVYGWIRWRKDSKPNQEIPVQRWTIQKILLGTVFGILGSVSLGTFMSRYTDADLPWVDATTSSFSLVATYMEAQRVLQGWWFWILLNTASVFIYHYKDSNVLAGQMVVYAVLSVVGLIQWRRTIQESNR